MDLNEEKKLVNQARNNPAAFAQLYDRYYSKILNYALRRIGHIEVAQDITAETFFKALKNIRQFQWRNISFSAWLYKIATNEIGSYFRKVKYKVVSLDYLREEEGFEPLSPYQPETEFTAAQEVLKKHRDFLVCQEKISHLPLKYQEVIVLRFFEEKEIKEISQILSKSEGTVKSLLHRGLEKLRKLMTENTENATL